MEFFSTSLSSWWSTAPIENDCRWARKNFGDWWTTKIWARQPFWSMPTNRTWPAVWARPRFRIIWIWLRSKNTNGKFRLVVRWREKGKSSFQFRMSFLNHLAAMRFILFAFLKPCCRLYQGLEWIVQQLKSGKWHVSCYITWWRRIIAIMMISVHTSNDDTKYNVFLIYTKENKIIVRASICDRWRKQIGFLHQKNVFVTIFFMKSTIPNCVITLHSHLTHFHRRSCI